MDQDPLVPAACLHCNSRFAGYSMLRINRVVQLKGAAHVWEVMLSRDAVFVNLLELCASASRVFFLL